MKSLIIGLDGATLDLIKPWVEGGELPTFGNIMDNGSYGILRSTLPPTTIPAWISLGTGKNPGKHGLFYMFHLTEDKRLKPTPPILRDYGFFWSQLAKKWNVGLLNIPFIRTKLKNGFCVPGRLPLDPYPKDMKNKLPAWEDLEPDWSKGEKYNLKILNRMVENQTKNIKYALKNWDLDLLFAFYVATDTIQHQFWGYMDESHYLYKESKYKDAILNLYKKIDDKLGEILKLVDENTNLLMLSDHGFQAYEYSIPINYWLKEEGYLKLKKGGERSSVTKLLKRGYEHLQGTWFEKLVPSKIKSQAVDSFFPKIDKAIDWNESVAYAATDGGGIFVEDEDIKEEIAKKLLEIENPYTGDKVIREVYSREEVYSGEYLRQAPHLLAVPQQHAWITCRLGYDSVAMKRPSIMSGSGTHARDGMIMAYGPDFENNKSLEADIIDVASTILELFGEECIKNADGRILKELLR
jgi:predicted AlkP superfamily phosphohydrolase/phosphomutase